MFEWSVLIIIVNIFDKIGHKLRNIVLKLLAVRLLCSDGAVFNKSFLMCFVFFHIPAMIAYVLGNVCVVCSIVDMIHKNLHNITLTHIINTTIHTK